MNQDDPQLEDELPPREQIALLMDDVRELVRAEIGYYKSRIDYSRHVVKFSWRFAMIAAFAFSGAAIALVMGLVMTLAPHVGPLFATLIVTIGFSIIGALAAIRARKWFKKIYFPELKGGSDDEGS